MPRLLAFDTSTDAMSLAVLTPNGVVARDSPGGALASARLVPELLALLDEAGVRLAELDAIAFGCGPGAFTGLRTACSVAQGLAFGAGKPVVPVDSLLIVAHDARLQLADVATAAAPDELWVAMDARMDEIYAARYAFAGGTWQVLDAPMLTQAQVLNDRWRRQAPQRVAGSALRAFAQRLETGDATLVPDALPRAAALLPLAQAAWARGEAVDAALALPVYLRDKVAQTTAEREAVRRAADAANAQAAGR